VHTVFWLQNLKGGDHSKDLGVDGKIILEWVLGKKYGGMAVGIHTFSSSELERGEWTSYSHSDRFTLGIHPTVPHGQEVEWAPEPVWTQRRREKSLSSPRTEPRSFST